MQSMHTQAIALQKGCAHYKNRAVLQPLLDLHAAAGRATSSFSCTSSPSLLMDQQGERQMGSLPPGFRFFPTDEELITFYLARKAMDAGFTCAAIRDVDLYKSEPWDLPRKAAAAGSGGGGGDEKYNYFFCKRGSRYPSGARARRATAAGYWKSTGKDKGVRCGGGGLVGTKKTLVFYRGRAPRGEKTSWVMHEYTLLGQRSSSACSSFQSGAHSEWVICRVFMKKPPSDHATPEMDLKQEDTVHGQTSPVHLRPKASDNGCDGEEVAPPPVLSDDLWHTNSRAMDGDRVKDDMVHHEALSFIMNRSSCASPSWLLYDVDDQLGPYCSALHILQQHAGASDNLPELLEYGGRDLPKSSASPGNGLTTGSEVGHRVEIWPASVASLHLDEPYWNFSF